MTRNSCLVMYIQKIKMDCVHNKTHLTFLINILIGNTNYKHNMLICVASLLIKLKLYHMHEVNVQVSVHLDG